MSQISLKSITGITSITTPSSGVDNQLTVHTNDTTERIKITSSGLNVSGVVTATSADINGDIDVDGHTNLDNVSIAGVTTFAGNILPGTDSSHNIGSNGVRFANAYVDTYYGDGSNLTGISAGTSLSGSTNNTVTTVTGANAIQGESNLTFDGTTLQVFTALSGTREQLNLKNQNASAGTSRINFFSTVSGTEFACAGIRNGVNTVNKGRLFLQTNRGSGLTNAFEIDENGDIKVTNGQFEIEGGGITFLTNESTLQSGSSSNMLGIQGGATYMGGRIELRGGQSGQSGDIRFFAQGATATQAERARIASNGRINIGSRTTTPDELVHIHTSSGQANIHVEGATDGQIILRAHSGDSVIHFGDASATSVGKIAYDHGTDSLAFNTNSNERMKIDSSGHLLPNANNTHDLGSTSLRWRNVYTTDLQLSNEGKTNDVDGTWGDYTIQEGESELFLINNRNGKKYQFMLKEVN